MLIFNKNRGFTLIEVMVVIAIMGLLAGIAVPNIMGIIERSRENIDLTKLFYLRDALNKALVEDEGALTKTTTAKNLSASDRTALENKLKTGLEYSRGATLFVFEVHSGLTVNVQDSHSEANNTYNVSAIIGTSGTWYNALKEAGFEGVADIVADRITGNYKKNTDTYTSFQWHDDKKNKDWQRTAPRTPMFISQFLNKGKKSENTRYTVNVRWTDVKNPRHSLEVFILPNGKSWDSALRSDHGVCFSTYGPAGCAHSD